jgi:hypothetical protein
MVALGNKPQFACMANHISSLPMICLDVAQLYRSAMFLVLYVEFESCFRTLDRALLLLLRYLCRKNRGLSQQVIKTQMQWGVR